MKNVLAVTLIVLAIFSLHTSVASARDVTAYHIGSYRINPKRTERIKGKRRRLENELYIMSLQLGANQTSLRNLSNGFHDKSNRQLTALYKDIAWCYKAFNGHTFNAKAYQL